MRTSFVLFFFYIAGAEEGGDGAQGAKRHAEDLFDEGHLYDTGMHGDLDSICHQGKKNFFESSAGGEPVFRRVFFDGNKTDKWRFFNAHFSGNRKAESIFRFE